MSSSAPDLAPAIVLGVDTPIGLTVVRELGREGVAVHGIGSTRRALGLYSRHLHKGYLRDSEDPIGQIRQIARESGARYLLAASEADISLLHSARSRLEDLSLLIPTPDRFQRVLDKELTLHLARSVGIRTPALYQIERMEELREILDEVSFPVVLKWNNPNLVRSLLAEHGLPMEKFQYAYDARELSAKLAVYENMARFPLIQEYARGKGLGHFIFMHKGQAKLRFQHQRLHEFPPEGGFSSVCAGLPAGANESLMAKSVALLQALDWEGPAMVEYRYDSDQDRETFMEVNGRFWGSLPLASASGARFAWLTYRLLGRGEEITGAEWVGSQLRCRFMVPETKRLWRILLQPGKIQDRSLRFHRWRELGRYLLDFLDPRCRYYIFQLSDPLPFVVDVWFTARKALLGR